MPRLIPVNDALLLIGMGDITTAARALELGIIDELITRRSPEDLLEAAVNLALSERVQGTLVSDRRVSTLSVKGLVSSDEFLNIGKSSNEQ